MKDLWRKTDPTADALLLTVLIVGLPLLALAVVGFVVSL